MSKRMIRRLSALALSAAIALTPITQAYAYTTHTVMEGEWLLAIARRYGVSADSIMAANGLSSDWIDVGMQLIIPSSSGGDVVVPEDPGQSHSGIHTVVSGDTLSGIASRYGVTVNQLMAWNGLGSSWLNVGDKLYLYDAGYVPSTPDPVHTDGNYVIQPGDTLSTIAQRFGLTVGRIKELNGLTSDWLYAGFSLYLPTDYVPAPSEWNGYLPKANATNGAHVVQAGDTLSGIAAVYGVTVADLYAWNGLSSDWLTIGQVIYVVPTQGPVNEPIIMPVETPDSDSKPSESEQDTPEEETSAELTINGMRIADLPERARPKTHRVEVGETIEGIATQYNTTVDHLRKWNRMDAEDAIEEGQELFVSNPALIPTIHEVAEGESLYDIAQEYETTEQWLMDWNELEDNTVEPETLLIVSNPEPKVHEVVPGETLQEIADQYEISLEDLRAWNGIPERVTIVNGTVLVSDPRVGNEEEPETEEEGNQETGDTTIEQGDTTIEEPSDEVIE